MSEEEIKSKKTVTNVDFKDKKLFENLERENSIEKEILM